MDWFLYDNGLRHERDSNTDVKYCKTLRRDFVIEHLQWLILNGERRKLKKNKCKCPKAAIVFKEKDLHWSLFFIKVFQRKCFPVNTGKFLRATFLKNSCERLLSDGGRLKRQ